jgi:hypothetical protein
LVVRHVSAVSRGTGHATHVAHYEHAAGRGVAAAVQCRKLWVGRDRRARRDVRHPNADGPAVRPYRKDSRALNRKLEAHLDRDHQIGHSYFMELNDVADLRFAWEHKVVPLL